jgi:DNA-binding transcriptional LysR family regulator
MILVLTRVLRFVAVAEHLSFTKAAVQLGIDQPWLSRQIMQLEDQLGFTLFDRTGNGISLTPEGREFYEAARSIAVAADHVQIKAEEMSRRKKSIVRIGVSYATIAVEARRELLDRYLAIRPNCELELDAVEWSSDVINQVLEGSMDFGICFGPVDEPNLEVCVLDDIVMTLAIPAEHKLAEKDSVSLEELKGCRIAVGLKNLNVYVHSRAYAWIDQVGAEMVHVPEGRRYIFDVADRERLFVGCYTSADKVPDSFVRRPISGAVPELNLCLIRYRRVMSAAAERFWRLAEEVVSEKHPGRAKPQAAAS